MRKRSWFTSLAIFLLASSCSEQISGGSTLGLPHVPFSEMKLRENLKHRVRIGRRLRANGLAFDANNETAT
jgi:hypothetical protein